MAAQPQSTSEAAILLLRQQKQSLRKQIRSRIKSTYPPPSSSSSSSSEAATTTNNNNLHDKSNQVFTRLFTLPEYKSAKSIGFFLSMPTGEIQTRTAIQQIVKDGKSLYVPRVGLDFEKCDMDLIECDTTKNNNIGVSTTTDEGTNEAGDDGVIMFYDSWPRNKWGIPEPPVTTTTAEKKNNVAKPGDIDLLIVPGLAFDTHGHRLGQGKGYYDRFIAKMRGDDTDDADEKGASSEVAGDISKSKKPLLVGVCLEEQFLEEVPHGVDLGDRNSSGGGSSSRGIIPVSDHDYIMDMVLSPSRTLVVPTS